MELKLRPIRRVWLLVLGSVLTLGLLPLFRAWRRRRQIWRMEDRGFQTRGGKLIAWTQVTGVRRVAAPIGSDRMIDEWILSTRRGRVSLPLWRIEAPEQAARYVRMHLPQGVAPPP